MVNEGSPGKTSIPDRIGTVASYNVMARYLGNLRYIIVNRTDRPLYTNESVPINA